MFKRATPFLLLSTLVILPATAGEAVQCDWETDACVKYMIESMEARGWMGLEVEYGDDKTPTIVRVVPGSPAEESGLEAGDRLVAFNGVSYSSAGEEALREVKKELVPGNKVQLTVERDGESMRVPLTAGKLPPAVLAQWIGSHLLEQHRQQYQTADVD